MNFLDLLVYVEKRPLMYLSEKNMKILESFITGYYLCEGLNDIPRDLCKIPSSPDSRNPKHRFSAVFVSNIH